MYSSEGEHHRRRSRIMYNYNSIIESSTKLIMRRFRNLFINFNNIQYNNIYYVVTDASSSNEAVHLQQRLKSLSTELVTLRNRLHVGQTAPPGSVLGGAAQNCGAGTNNTSNTTSSNNNNNHSQINHNNTTNNLNTNNNSVSTNNINGTTSGIYAQHQTQSVASQGAIPLHPSVTSSTIAKITSPIIPIGGENHNKVRDIKRQTKHKIILLFSQLRSRRISHHMEITSYPLCRLEIPLYHIHCLTTCPAKPQVNLEIAH